ncbi:hypothetical protein [Actinomadura roseirufa]|uniref:hypothetical protein n=1 Tax=Actinomadura roseirufa TaxID=2094049 RepID=UPI0010415D14|nr:hypothetical protein [Actinomadura roseirufa]
MTPCDVTTGFFVLGRCGRPAVTGCPQCGRPVCGEHAAPQGGHCPECLAALGHGSRDPHDPSWVAGYRRRHYERTSETYNDTTWYSSFDAYDRGAFEPGSGYTYDEGDFGSDGTGFVDS